MKNLWTEKEIKLTCRYEKSTNEICSYPEEFYPDEMESEIIFLEVQMRIINKYLIGCQDDKLIGIFTFSEALKAQKSCNEHGELFYYYPINFKSEKQFIKLLDKA